MTDLCRLAEIEDGQGRGFTVQVEGGRSNIVVVRKGPAVFGYRNMCPHTGRSLDYFPDQFMDKTGAYILCLNHDARFRVEDGVCFAGPCLGQRLKPVTVRVNGDGYVTFITGH